MSVKKFENHRWENKDQTLVFRHLAALELIEKGPVLDLGCGDGFFLELLRRRGIQGEGLDISQAAIRKAKEKGLKVQQFDFTQAPLFYKDDFFTTVILLDVLEHLYEPEVVIREAYRVTKRDLIIAVPNFVSLPARLQVFGGGTPENNTLRKGHVFWVTFSKLKNMLERNGFIIEELKVNSFFSRIPILNKVMRFLAQIRPSLFALTFVIKAKKV